MQPELIAVMHDQVTAIYRASTGTPMPEPEPAPPPGSAGEASDEEITRHFADLQAAAQNNPSLAERIPPFSFTPPLDVIGDEEQLTLELAVPGVDWNDVHVEVTSGQVIVSGVRRGYAFANGQGFRHAEIPRGPFYRAFELPLAFASSEEPALALERGLLCITLRKKESHSNHV